MSDEERRGSPLPEGYEYQIDHTPWGIAQGADVELSLRESDDGRHTRRVVRWHSGVKDGERRLSISLIHQRRSLSTGRWEDTHFDLRDLKAGEEVALELDAEQTAKLIAHLGVLQSINERLRTERDATYTVHREGEIVVPREFGTLIEQLRGTSDNPDELARNLALVAPDLAENAGIIRLHRLRADALAEFKRHLDAEDWSEGGWQTFFEANDWIFGHGLDYRFLVTEQAQATYGGGDVTGRGGQEGDFLMGTAGEAAFSVLVEIKRPDSVLIDNVQYRNGAWRPSKDLTGGVAQLQANCQQWLIASRQVPNSRWADNRGLTTAQPKGILVIGNAATIADDPDKKESFERFRNSLSNPEVVTYDELCRRAEFILARTAADEDVTEPTNEPADSEWGDLPF